MLNELVSSIERSRAGMVEEIQVKQAATERRAEGFIQDLEREISDLQLRSAELEKLSHTDDPLLLLEVSPFLTSQVRSIDRTMWRL